MLPPLAPVTLRGSHVALEPLSLDHLPALEPVALDDELWRLAVARVRDRDELRAYVEQALDEQRRGVSLPFAIVHAGSGRAAGSTRFGNVDRANGRVEIGWTWVGREWQRTAVNTEAKYLLLRHAFETLGCIRVELKTDALNLRSRAAIRRLGATEEGILRRHTMTDSGRVRDTVYHSILDDEWPRVKTGLEEKLRRGGA
jgi:RimJ/RimL family protein N-acetyltransferase